MLSPPLGSVFFHYLLHYILDLGVFMAALEECLLGACGWLEVGNMAGPLSTKAKNTKQKVAGFLAVQQVRLPKIISYSILVQIA